MKNSLTTILFLTLTMFTSETFGQQVQKKDVYTFASSTMLEQLFDAKSLNYESIKFNVYKVKLNGYNVFISIDDGDLIFRTYFEGNPSLNRINDFNAQYRWVRVYIDGDGDLTVAQELSFTGGITLVTVHVALNTYGDILDKFSEHMQ